MGMVMIASLGFSTSHRFLAPYTIESVRLMRQRTHGRSLMPLLAGEATSVRDALLTGVLGREVVLVTERHKYVRAPVGANAPLSMLSNRWSTMPTHGALDAKLALPFPVDRAFLDHMPGSDLPVIHQTWRGGDRVAFWAWVRW